MALFDGLLTEHLMESNTNDSFASYHGTNQGVSFNGEYGTFSTFDRIRNTGFSGAITGEDFTWAGWINVNAIQNSQTFVAYEHSSGVGQNMWFKVYGHNNNAFIAQVWGSTTSAYINSGPTIVQGSWYYVGLVSRGGVVEIYHQGIKKGTGAVVGTTNVGANNAMYYGSNETGTSAWFTGKQKRFRVWNRGLTELEMAELYAYETTPPPAEAVPQTFSLTATANAAFKIKTAKSNYQLTATAAAHQVLPNKSIFTFAYSLQQAQKKSKFRFIYSLEQPKIATIITRVNT